MKGIILAGGLGTRLKTLTKVTNKHLLPVYDKPMIFYPLETLVGAGLTDIMVITGGNNAGDFLRLLGNGKEFGLRRLHYAYQEGEGGIADALALAEAFADNDLICVVLGDNIIERPINPYVEQFRKQGHGAKILLKKVQDPGRFGVAELKKENLIKIHEKPNVVPSPYAVTGVYMYDHRVFNIIRTLECSDRGEFEITDVNNRYIGWGEMTYNILDGWWTDAGTKESLLQASILVADRAKKTEKKKALRLSKKLPTEDAGK